MPRFVPAEFGYDSLNPVVRELLPPYVERAKVIDFLKGKQAQIEWVGLATGLDINRRLVDGNMGVDLAWQSATVYGKGEDKFAASTPGFVGELVKAVIENWADFRNRYLCISEVSTSYREILDALERETESKFEVGYLEKEEGFNEAKRRIDGGWPDAGMFLMERAALANKECFEGFARDEDVKATLKVHAHSLNSIVKDVVHDFNHHGKGGCGCS